MARVDVLIIAGGGGSYWNNGGAGAGGYKYLLNQVVKAPVPIVVGEGGVGMAVGGDSSFGSTIAHGGGCSQTPGGSGGGHKGLPYGPPTPGAPGIPGEGYDGGGGDGGLGEWNSGGGGGGAGGKGGDGNASGNPIYGGIGITDTLFGLGQVCGGGSGDPPASGIYGGGTFDGNATRYGGGSGGTSAWTTKSGYQGIVCVRYVTAEYIADGEGGTITHDATYTYHKFTTVGSFTFIPPQSRPQNVILFD